jgi:bifunctional DNase/RNase
MLLLVLVIVQPAATQSDSDSDLVPVELSTVGVDPRSATPVVLLREPSSGRVVPIWVGDAEARAILLALRGIALPRPMTHDLMATLLSELKASVHEVVVHDMVDNTYIATIRLRVPGQETLRDVDSRPSDALALALRTGAAIRMSRKVIQASPPEFDFIAPEGPDQIVRLLGMTVVAPTPDLRREFGVPGRPGVIVTSVTGRAQKRGVRRGDLVIQVNGRDVREPMDFYEAIRTGPRDRPVRLVIVRPGEEVDIELPPERPVPVPEDRFRV